jgi:predicted transcriptional regulator
MHFICVVCGDDCPVTLMCQTRTAASPECGPKYSHHFIFVVSTKGETFLLLPCKVSPEFVPPDFINCVKSGELEILCIQRVRLQCRGYAYFMTMATVLSLCFLQNCSVVPFPARCK